MILYLSVKLKTDLLCIHPLKSLRFAGRIIKVSGAQNLGQGHSACFKSNCMLRTITMQGLTFLAITPTEKCTLILEST